MEDIKGSFQMMCRAMNGGWSGMAAALNTSVPSLQNSVYCRKGQQMSVVRALAMQKASGTTYFAEAIAHESGGLFIKLPSVDSAADRDIQEQFVELLEKAGVFAAEWRKATEDNEVCQQEKRQLERFARSLCRHIHEILHTTFKIFCQQEK